jgi:tetratricopeptide (TPR) repeat protein
MAILAVLALTIPAAAQLRLPPLPSVATSSSSPAPDAPVYTLEEIAYNENVPPLITDTDLLKDVKFHAPQWVQQSIVWPSSLERRIHSGISSFDQRAAMIAWLDAAFYFKPMPPELALNAVEMRNWLVLFSDWARYSGADAFIMRFTNKGYALHITEATTNLVLIARPERPLDANISNPKAYAMNVANDLFHTYLLPGKPELVLSEPVEDLPGGLAGSWQPGLAGRTRRAMNEEFPPLAIRFFVVDSMVAFNINKEIWRHTDNPTLYTKRFTPPRNQESETEILEAIQDETLSSPRLTDPAERIVFYERLRQQLNIKTVEEFLGPMLFDSRGERITSKNIDYQRLISVVESLNQDQRDFLLNQRKVDTFYIEGMRALEQNDIDLALNFWMRALDAEPSNVRVNVLLEVALNIKVEREFGGNADEANNDPIVRNARELQAFHRKTVLRESVERLERERMSKEIEEMRARGIDLYKQGMYEESKQMFQRILRRDPNNATALLWLTTITSRQGDLEVREVVPGSNLQRMLREKEANP